MDKERLLAEYSARYGTIQQTEKGFICVADKKELEILSILIDNANGARTDMLLEAKYAGKFQDFLLKCSEDLVDSGNIGWFTEKFQKFITRLRKKYKISKIYREYDVEDFGYFFKDVFRDLESYEFYHNHTEYQANQLRKQGKAPKIYGVAYPREMSIKDIGFALIDEYELPADVSKRAYDELEKLMQTRSEGVPLSIIYTRMFDCVQ